MNYLNIDDENVIIQTSCFKSKNGTDEYHLMIKPKKSGSVEEHLSQVLVGYKKCLDQLKINIDTAVFQRYFTSDLINQADYIKSIIDTKKCAVSIIEQPPMPDKKLVFWAYHVVDENKTLNKSNGVADLVLERNGYKHFWNTNIESEDCDSFKQTDDIFVSYNDVLENNQLKMKNNVIRTWIYVRNVDNNYNGVVVARRELFAKYGLNKDSHFIASTGIEGRSTKPETLVSMDAYAIEGIKEEQVKFLQALDNLNPTHEYGVTFERGTSVEYGDRNHIFISGTASIDNKGEVVHPGDIQNQTIRTIENIEALLADAKATLDDVSKFIVYIRDTADYNFVENYMNQNFNQTPYVIVLAPVCRPGWLIEIECIAVTENHNIDYNNF